MTDPLKAAARASDLVTSALEPRMSLEMLMRHFDNVCYRMHAAENHPWLYSDCPTIACADTRGAIAELRRRAEEERRG